MELQEACHELWLACNPSQVPIIQMLHHFGIAITFLQFCQNAVKHFLLYNFEDEPFFIYLL